MKSKHFCLSSIVLILSLCVTFTASGAMRNLLNEFHSAIYAGDMNKVNSLIKEGLFVNDAIEPAYNFCLKISEIISIRPDAKTLAAENFCVSLVKTLSRAKADFTNSLARYDNYKLSANILKAFLEAGADPDKTIANRVPSALFLLLESASNAHDIEKISLLVEHKASLTKGIYGFRDHAMCFFLQHRGLASTSNLTSRNLNFIFSVVDILRKAGADTSDAKKYLASLRDKYRNIPDALRYVNEIEKRIDKSMLSDLWDSLTGSNSGQDNADTSSLLAASVTGNKVNVRNSIPNGRVLFQVSMSNGDRLIVDKIPVNNNGGEWYRARYIRRQNAEGKIWYDKAGGFITGRFLRLEPVSDKERSMLK